MTDQYIYFKDGVEKEKKKIQDFSLQEFAMVSGVMSQQTSFKVTLNIHQSLC